MTESALRNYKAAREQRLGKNDARRIRAERDKARSPTSGADRRWVFELLQNAHDPGPRDGSLAVDLRLVATNSTLVLQHNGRPFTLDDLAALLSGGSNKEYESTDTTGRFGTGFLVTHVLSPKIMLRGVISNGSQCERFQIDLDRSGDEDEILENIRTAESGVQTAMPVARKDNPWTAEFEYPIDSHEAVDVGVETMRLSTPFLFGTCQHLGRVTIVRRDGVVESWRPEKRTQYDYEGTMIGECLVTLERNGSSIAYRVLRLTPAKTLDVGLVVLLRNFGEEWEFQRVPNEIPRVFSRFPVRTSTFLPINCVIDGEFDVQVERDRIAMSDADKQKLKAALRLIPVALKLGLSEDWDQRYWLAQVAAVDSAFSETTSEEELRWWNDRLCEVAEELARLPLVKTAAGVLPAVPGPEERHADFVVPRYSKAISTNEFPDALVWKVAAGTTILVPPVQELVSDWNRLSAGWDSLGMQVRRLGLKEIAEEVRTEAHRLGDLPVHGDPRAWLAHYMHVLGELPASRNYTELVKELLPNQTKHGDLCSADELKRDAGIPDELKDIAEAIGYKVRECLFDKELASRCPTAVVEKLISAELTEDEVLKECLDHLSSELPDGQELTDDSMHLVDGSIRLLGYIWTSRGPGGATFARRCPLVTREQSIAYYSSRKIMAPVLAWPEQARPFADVYAPGRVLGDMYCEALTDSGVVSALVTWEIAFPEPLIRDRRAEITGAVLQELADARDLQGVVLRNEEFSQVALLATEVIQRCQDDEERAAQLLGLILAYLAPRDQGWRQQRSVVGKREGTEVTIKVCDALWVADLKSRAWVPIRGEQGNERVVPSPASLDPLLKKCKQWLSANDSAIDFLIKCFKFDVLNLRLGALSEEVKDRISERLAALVQMGGGNTDFYEEVLETLAGQQRREAAKERNRQFGLAVQDAIQSHLTDRGLAVKVIDRGYDLDVEAPEDVLLIEAGIHRSSVGPYLVEVKATTTGEVRLTPAQAKVASHNDEFVLCVVDLRGVAPARLGELWVAVDVEPLARIVTGLRQTVNETHVLVEAATEQEVAIRNEGQLRYGVPTAIWETGEPINSWVKRIAPNLATQHDQKSGDAE